MLPGSLYFRVALDSLSFAKKTTTACSLAFHCFAFILYIKRSPWTPKICLWTPRLGTTGRDHQAKLYFGGRFKAVTESVICQSAFLII